MSEQIELSEILSGSTPDGVPIEREERAAPEPAAPVEKAEAVEAAPIEKVQSRKKAFQQKERDTREAGNGRVRDPETGQYVPKAAEPVAETPVTEVKAETQEPAPQQSVKEPPKQEFTEKERAFLAAAQEERRKRQALEHQLAELQKKPAEEKKTFWDDPEAALQHFQQQTETAITKTRLDTAEAIARTKYKDFDANVAEFAELMQTVPGVKQQWLAATDPAEFAYQVGKRQKELKSIGNLEEYRANIERETRAKLEAEYKAKEEERRKLAADLPTSLSDVRGSNPSNRVVFAGPPSFEDILSGR
jgi:hypothetical protein